MKKNSGKFSKNWNSVHSLTVYSRRVVPPPLLPLLPIFFHQARFLLKITVRFKAICLKNLASNGPEDSKNSNLARLETINADYQLMIQKRKGAKIIKKCCYNENSLNRYRNHFSRTNGSRIGRDRLSDTENQAYYVPVPAEREEALKIVNEFRPLYENETSMKVGQNIKYDILVLQNYGMEVKGELFDTMIAHYVLQPELRHNMDYLAEIYLHYQTIHIDELIGPRGKNQKNMRDLPPEEVYKYACEDADITLKLKNVLEEELKKQGVEHLLL